MLAQDYVGRAPGEIGDFGAIAKPVDEDEWEKVQMAELKHGRLAMLAVLGCFAQEMVTGEGPVEQLFTGNVSAKHEMWRGWQGVVVSNGCSLETVGGVSLLRRRHRSHGIAFSVVGRLRTRGFRRTCRVIRGEGAIPSLLCFARWILHSGNQPAMVLA